MCGNLNLIFVEPLPPGGIIYYLWIRNAFIHLQLQQTVDESVGSAGRYRPPRCINPNLVFAKPEPSGDDNVTSPDQKFFHTATTQTNRRRKMFVPRIDTVLHGVEIIPCGS